eukprot:scpid43575/ scgid28689/ Sorting nexin-33; SH3 and PX domain-containing protein 3
MVKVRVLYDFEGDSGGGELTITEGDVLFVTNQDVGDGWWEGRMPSGQIGLFPETYVEVIPEGAAAAPSAPPVQVAEPAAAATAPQDYAYDQNQGYAQEEEDGYRDRAESWDEGGEWDESGTQEPAPATSTTSSLSPNSAAYLDGADGAAHSREFKQSESGIQRSGTIRKNINRFSTFVKSGGEAFLLGETKARAAGGEEVALFQSPEGPRWTQAQSFELTVTEPTKKSKLKGMKSFIAYTISMSTTGELVERRYKHFDWLHDRLVEKFTVLAVPPLPDKQYAGRYGEDFIEKRRERLEMWLNRVARHPVISRSMVFQHFLTCKDEKAWKVGKRRAEKDELVGSEFFITVTRGPDIDATAGDQEVDHFGRFVKSMDDNMVRLKTRCQEHCEQHSGVFTREYQKLGLVFTKLSETFAMEEKPYAGAITEAFGQTGRTYESVAKLYEEQPKNDLLPLLDVIREYLGMLSTYPDMVEVQKESSLKIQQCRKLQEEEKMADSAVQQIADRGTVLTASMQAEINHFHSERVIDLKAAMQHFMKEQIAFHERVIDNLREALGKYDGC